MSPRRSGGFGKVGEGCLADHAILSRIEESTGANRNTIKVHVKKLPDASRQRPRRAVYVETDVTHPPWVLLRFRLASRVDASGPGSRAHGLQSLRGVTLPSQPVYENQDIVSLTADKLQWRSCRIFFLAHIRTGGRYCAELHPPSVYKNCRAVSPANPTQK
jgi:hypothetical protein